MKIWDKYKAAERRQTSTGRRSIKREPTYCPQSLHRFMNIKGNIPRCTLPNDGHMTHDDQTNRVRWESPAPEYFQNIEVY